MYCAVVKHSLTSQFHNHAQSLKVQLSGGPLDNQTWHINGWPQQKLPKFGCRTHTTALWPVEQSSFLSAKFDRPVTRQNCSLLATAHDCETDLFAMEWFLFTYFPTK